ncbi:MAG TPA: hypothetical protein VFN57_17605 [Thermomicrobiaceae bacterium]|nr:hypothetical protein [Thermomicrobiaceae bacterium]
MRRVNPKLMIALIAASLVVSLAVVVPAVAGEGRTILQFNTMVGVQSPYTGSANPIRGINGGGLPWAIMGAQGVLQANGHLELNVHGLVIAPNTTNPALVGTNPIPNFKAVVSCMSVDNGTATTVNVSTGLFPATTTGDAHINTTVSLPSPCIAPIVFVTSPTGAWFAATGN